jgi:hypothetical protein
VQNTRTAEVFQTAFENCIAEPRFDPRSCPDAFVKYLLLVGATAQVLHPTSCNVYALTGSDLHRCRDGRRPWHGDAGALQLLDIEPQQARRNGLRIAPLNAHA